jgi:hypothetical protein
MRAAKENSVLRLDAGSRIDNLKASSAEVEGSEEVAKAATKSDDLAEELRSKAKDRRFSAPVSGDRFNAHFGVFSAGPPGLRKKY